MTEAGILYRSKPYTGILAPRTIHSPGANSPGGLSASSFYGTPTMSSSSPLTTTKVGENSMKSSLIIASDT